MSEIKEGGGAGAGGPGGPGPSAKLETLPEDRIAKLATAPNTTVYKYTHDTPEITLSSAEQARCLRSVCVEFDELCRKSPKASVECLRETLLRQFPHLRRFQQAYPALFATTTFRADTPQKRAVLTKFRKTGMAFIVSKVDGEASAKPFNETEAAAMTLAARLSMRDARPEDIADEGRGLVARLNPDAPTSAALTPLDFDSFGGTVVNQ
jgi:hypothetical protein